MKDINKIINETEFLVQKPTGGWGGYHIYLRHKIWSKFSVKIECDKKPRLTKKIKEELVKMAIHEKEIEEHNMPIWSKLETSTFKMHDLWTDIFNIMFEDNDLYDAIEKTFMDNCELPSFNQALQRLKDSKSHMDEYRSAKKDIRPRQERVIKWTIERNEARGKYANQSS